MKARDRERELGLLTLEKREEIEDRSRGKTRRAMTFTEGAHATTMARWFSRTDQIMALANHPGIVLVC